MYPLGQPVRPEFRKPGISRTGGVIPPAGQVSNLWESSTQQCSGRTWPGGPRPGPAASASLCPTTPVWGLPRTGAPKPAWNGWAGVVACGNEQGGDRLDAHPVDHSGLIERRSPSPGLLEETDDDRSSAGRRPSTSRSALLRRGAPRLRSRSLRPRHATVGPPECNRDDGLLTDLRGNSFSIYSERGRLAPAKGVASGSSYQRIRCGTRSLGTQIPASPFLTRGFLRYASLRFAELTHVFDSAAPSPHELLSRFPGFYFDTASVVKPSPADAQIVRRPAPMCHSAWPVPSE